MNEWAFTLRTKISPLQRIQSDKSEMLLDSAVNGRDLTIRSADFDENGEVRPFKFATIIDFEIRGFDTEKDAFHAGLQFRDELAVASTSCRIWLDYGASRDEHGNKDSDAEVHGARSRMHGDRLGLITHRGPALSASGIGAFLVNSGNFDEFTAAIMTANRSDIVLTERQRVALELYGLAHFESTPRAEFLILTSVIEVLAVRQPRPSESLELIDVFLQQADNLDPPQSLSLAASLRELRHESISSACRRLVESSLGKRDAKRFREIYGSRSQILHSGNPNSAGEFYKDVLEIDGIISRLVRKLFLPTQNS